MHLQGSQIRGLRWHWSMHERGLGHRECWRRGDSTSESGGSYSTQCLPSTRLLRSLCSPRIGRPCKTKFARRCIRTWPVPLCRDRNTLCSDMHFPGARYPASQIHCSRHDNSARQLCVLSTGMGDTRSAFAQHAVDETNFMISSGMFSGVKKHKGNSLFFASQRDSTLFWRLIDTFCWADRAGI